jgi:hypothetical protein
MENLVVGAPLPQNGRKVVVLMTDGLPATGSEQQCTDAVSAEVPKGITTFAVGIGPFPSTNTGTYDPVFMGGLGQAGGAAPVGCNPKEAVNEANLCFTQITPGADTAKMKQAFVDALNKIRKATASCELAAPAGVDPDNFNVAVKSGAGDDQVIPQGPSGWTFDTVPPTKVLLHGAACDRLKLDPKASASFITGCRTIKG